MFLSSYNNIQFSSVIQSCLTLCDPINCSTTGFPVYHQLLEITQTHVHGVGDAIQSSPSLSSPSPPAFNLSQHQDLFQAVSSSHQVAKLLELSFSMSPSIEYSGWFPLTLTGLIFLLSKGLSRVFSNTTVQKHKFLSDLVPFSRSVASDSATPWITARQASLSITNSRSSLKLITGPLLKATFL